jgi:ABC-type multidrug transport system fused ATPase/permease subunit
MKPFDPRLLKHARRARLPVAAVAVLGAAAAGLIIVQAQLLANAIAAAFEGSATLAALRGASADGLAAVDAAIEVIETQAPPAGDRPAPAPYAIRAEGLSVVHPGRSCPAPDNFSALLRAGEITVLAGPSGSGKSTLVDVLLGFAQPSAGRVTIDGEDLAHLDPETWRALVGWVPQQPYLSPGRSRRTSGSAAPMPPTKRSRPRPAPPPWMTCRWTGW